MSLILISGASSGIGAAIARAAAKKGYDLAITARRIERLQHLRMELEREGIRVLTIQADFSDWEQIQRVAQTTLDAFGKVDILINNAGFGRINWLDTLDGKGDIANQIQVNLIAPIQLTRLILPSMKENRNGLIINIASLASLIATPTYSVYAASKFGLHGFTEALRREVRGDGIRVCGVYPGGVETEFGEKAGIERKSRIQTPQWMRLTAEEVAQVTLGLIQRPRRQVIIPSSMSLVVWLNRLMPGLVDWIIQRGFVMRERSLSQR